MSKRSGISFTRRAPDNLTEELIAVLSSKASFEFKPLFEIILLNLRERNAAVAAKKCCVCVLMKSFRALSIRARSNGRSQESRRSTKALLSEWVCCALRKLCVPPATGALALRLLRELTPLEQLQRAEANFFADRQLVVARRTKGFEHTRRQSVRHGRK
jgi:hypothetical protein